MIYVFDLDNTLLDSIKLKKSLAAIMHFSENEFKISRDKYFAGKNNLYSPLQHVKILYEKREISLKQRKKFLEDIKKMAANVDTFIFPEVKKILKSLSGRNNDLVLLTHGDLSWQRLKLKHMSIKKFFNKIIITDKDKIKKLRFLKNINEKIVVINDNVKENLLIKKYLPQAEIFLIHGPHAKNIKHKERVYKLKDVLKIYENKKGKN